MAEELGNRNQEANCLHGLGDIDWVQGRYEDARARWVEAAQIWDALGATYNRDVERRMLAALDSETGQTTLIDLTHQTDQPPEDPAGASS